MGYQPRELAGGVVAEITGTETGRCLLLRADMDALRVTEQTGLDFASANGCMHACGHIHARGDAARCGKLLREYQDELNGTVKLVFQPDEEGFTGAEGHALGGRAERPGTAGRLCAARQFGHAVRTGSVRTRHVYGGLHAVPHYGKRRWMPRRNAGKGRGSAQYRKPHLPVAAGDHQPRDRRKTPAVVTIGRMTGGEAPNIIPQTAVLEGTIRSFDRDLSAQIFTRIGEIAQCTAQAFRGTAVTEEITSAPPLRNDAVLTNRMARPFAGALFGEKLVYRLDEGGMGSEDFASYTYDLPCAYLLIGAGTKQENPAFGEPMHNERVCSTGYPAARRSTAHMVRAELAGRRE